MRTTIIAAAMAMALCACTQPNVEGAPDDYPDTGQARAGNVSEPAPRFSYERDALQMAPFVLRDMETGCEYVATTLFQNDVQLTPRMERSDSVLRQRCVSAMRTSGYRWIGGEETPALRVSTFHDLQTGCDYVAATLFQKGSALIPRMTMLPGGEVVHLCRSPR